jgi:hypothetical protein
LASNRRPPFGDIGKCEGENVSTAETTLDALKEVSAHETSDPRFFQAGKTVKDCEAEVLWWKKVGSK